MLWREGDIGVGLFFNEEGEAGESWVVWVTPVTVILWFGRVCDMELTIGGVSHTLHGDRGVVSF